MIIPHNVPTIGLREKRALSKIVDSKWIGPGFAVTEFESQVGAIFGLPGQFVVAVSSGTAALHLALMGASLSRKVVQIPAYACVAIENAITGSALLPEHLDSQANSPLIPEDTHPGELIGATVGISTFGHQYIFSPKKNALQIADITHSFGFGKKDRDFSGDVAVASLAATKLITTGGQGGVVICRSSAFAQSIRDFRDFDMKKDLKPRLNFQMTDLQAAFGIVQLRRLNEFIEKREVIHQLYASMLPNVLPKKNESVAYRTLIKVNNPYELSNFLATRRIASIIPYERKEMAGNLEEFANAGVFTDTSLSIPNYPSLKIRDARRIAQNIMEYKSL